MPSSFRPYTKEELTRAAESYGLDPAFVQAVYSVESSNGTDPNAMKARTVKRKRDSTIVRGPFQLEDGTASDIIRKNKLGPVNVDDPDTHLDLAMRLMSDLRDRYDGDYRKMAQAYLGGPGGVTNPSAKDELGTTTQSYGNKILAEMNRLQATPDAVAPGALSGGAMGPPSPDADPLGTLQPFMVDAGGDMFGMGDDVPSLPSGASDRVRWGDLVAANRSGNSPVGLGIPDEMGGDLTSGDIERADTIDLDQYIARLVNEEMGEKDYSASA